MAYYTEFKFDEDMFLKDFDERCQVAHEYALLAVMSDIHGSDVWRDAYIKKINDQYADIVTDSIVAFMEIFGTGNKMANESQNPYLAKYKRSKQWKDAKRPDDGTVMYRPEEYRSLDWKNDKRQYIDREGSGKEGVYKDFPAQAPDFSKMTMVLEKYSDHLRTYLNKELDNINVSLYFYPVKVEV